MKLLLAAVVAVLLAGQGIVIRNRLDPDVGRNLTTCGMQLNNMAVVFCDTFDTAYPDSTTRTGDLDENVWGVSRTVGQQNGPNPWPTSSHTGCGLNTTAAPPNDLIICNGRLIESVNDAHQVIVLAMYPKQPFDWSGRTGTVSFDVTNDTQGSHAAWPEFWITDKPIPAPYDHFGSWISHPANAFGVRLEESMKPGDGPGCHGGSNASWRWRVGEFSAIVVRNYIWEDLEASDTGSTPSSPALSVTVLDCVVAPDPVGHEPQGAALGLMNHVEMRVSQNSIEVWASDAGSTTLYHIATVNNANLSFSRGLVWVEDAHYNASKGVCHQLDPEQSPELPECQLDHSFGWDNVAFDGPFVYRDFSYDAMDATATGPTYGDGSTSTLRGKSSTPSTPTSWDVLSMPANPQANVVRVMFNAFIYTAPTSFDITVNGHAHSQNWPYPDTLTGPFTGQQGGTWRTTDIVIPITDLVTGTNTVTVGGDQNMEIANVNIVLVDVPGGVPALPGANNAYPGTDAWVNVTGNLSGAASECGNLTRVSAVPASSQVLAGVAASGLWSNLTGTTWTQLGSGITNRPMRVVYDPLHAGTFWVAGFYDGSGAFRNGVHKTTDGGATFTALGTVSINDSVSVDFTDAARQTLIAGGHEQSQTVYKSTNGGSTWTNVGTNIPSDTRFTSEVYAVSGSVFLANAQGYAGTTEGIYRSTDGGSSWTRVHTQGPTLAPLVTATGTIYWPYGDGLLKSTDSGASWTLVGSGLDTITPVQLPSGNLLSTGAGVLKTSTNGGTSWSTLGPTQPFTPVSLAYSTGQRAAFISHFDCGSTVPTDAVARLYVIAP